MSVAKHLNIQLREYDRRIRSFIPNYEEMLHEAASRLRLLKKHAPVLVDLGIGTGALAMRCLAVKPRARLVGVDGDGDVLAWARRRLQRGGRRLALQQSDFLAYEWQRCDAVVSSLALHHIATPASKQGFYARCFAALREGGFLIHADCMPSQDQRLAAQEFELWEAHLRRTYSPRQTRGYFNAWAREDSYFSLPEEMAMLRKAGFSVEVAWRRGLFAVLWAHKSRARKK